MARIDDLRPDQRAALQLLLQQGRSYDEIASLLRMEPEAVAERARSALDALGPEDMAELSLEEQDDVADYLLGQQSASQRARTRDLLEGSPAGRAWARAVSSELRPLAGENLPDIPAEAAEVEEAFGALGARTAHRERVERSSRVGGAILIAAAVIALVGLVALGLSLAGGDDDDEDTSASGTTTQTQTQESRPRAVAQINLTPPEGVGGKLAGVAQVFEQGDKRTIVLVAEGLRRATEQRFYAIWIYKSPEQARRLGFPPQPNRRGQLATQFDYPDDARDYDQLIVTQESDRAPKQPGRILLSGPLQGTQVTGAETAPSTTP